MKSISTLSQKWSLPEAVTPAGGDGPAHRGARLTRLRIAGFKSFAEPAALDILPGLTGIVGPNGCGKSNVVEALRWAMGETSAKSLRGGEMDDVIFAGTMARPSRNLAEVTITLEGALPAPFEAETELLVTRRIERGAGSMFRANGRELRARDVQTFYADLASGARSSGMVSQGRVSALVNAKPEARRQVLEEAAGITGLHARRHEAELKLRAAEANLARAEDLRTQLEATRDGLRKQARQAARYRNLSGLIRDAEAEHLAVLHAQACLRLTAAEEAFAHATLQAEAAERSLAGVAATLALAEAGLPEPRAQEAESRRVLERRRLEAEGQAAEAARAAKDAGDAQARVDELHADFLDAATARQDASSHLERLRQECDALAGRMAALPGAIAAAGSDAVQTSQAVLDAEEEAHAASLAASEAAAAARQAAINLADAASRAESARASHADVLARHAQAEAALVPLGALAAARAAREAAEQALAEARRHLETADTAYAEAVASHGATRLAADRAVAGRRGLTERRDEAARRNAGAGASRENFLAEMRDAEAARVPAENLLAARNKVVAAEAATALADSALTAAETGAEDAAATQARLAREASDHAALRARIWASRSETRERLKRLGTEITDVSARLEAAEAGLVPRPEMLAAEAALREAERDVAGTEAALLRLSDARGRAETFLAARRTACAEAAAQALRLGAEAEGLEGLLGADTASSLLDQIQVPAGLEAALAACLGDGADSSLDAEAAKFWRGLPDLLPKAWPEGAVCLADLIRPPPALGRALGFVALLPDGADGDDIQTQLSPGQIAVTRDGAVWRWDGHVVRPHAPNPAAVRLVQRNRLASLRPARVEAEHAADAARRETLAAEDALREAADFYNRARARRAAAETSLHMSREGAATLAARQTQAELHLSTLRPSLARLLAEQANAGAALDAAESRLAALPDEVVLAQTRRDAEAACAAASATLDQARSARLAARASLAAAEDGAQRLTRTAADCEARLAALTPQWERAREDAETAARGLREAQAALDQHPDPSLAAASLAESSRTLGAAQHAAQAARAARDAAEKNLDAARDTVRRLEAESVQTQSRFDALNTLLHQSARGLRDAEAALAKAQTAQSALADPATLAETAMQARQALALARAAHAQAESRLTHAEGDLARATEQEKTGRSEREGWQARLTEAERREEALRLRVEAARCLCDELAEAPARLAERAAQSGAVLQEAEAAHHAWAQKLADADAALRNAALAQGAAHAAHAATREALARAEGARDAAAAGLRAVLARAIERLGADSNLPEAAEPSDIAETRARQKFDRLSREREEMGPVNLCAEQELLELDERIGGIEREREDLATAIAKLRGAIGHLNREGRARLAAVFAEVDQHFRTLFTRMMGGGRAHLAWAGSDDPLEAGLEIFAEPPGKKLAALSLLSGGEQALTALSLIFAVFRCNPAPVSVLDEVDAPLDDANVERFCALLDDVVRDTGTRFLVVTHHQLTMSRMDRLFGVTMQERGVSRLLSVDLQRAAAMVALAAE